MIWPDPRVGRRAGRRHRRPGDNWRTGDSSGPKRPAAAGGPGPTEAAAIRAEAVPVAEGAPGRRHPVTRGGRALRHQRKETAPHDHRQPIGSDRRGTDRSPGAVPSIGGRGAGGADRPTGSQARGAAPPAWPRELAVKVIIYGDFKCLYCHLSSQRADRLVRAGTANVEWRAPSTGPGFPSPAPSRRGRRGRGRRDGRGRRARAVRRLAAAGVFGCGDEDTAAVSA